MKNKACIIGAGLAGVLTAIKCSELGFEVHLCDKSSKILGNFSSIKLSGYNINPGFYCIEYPRASKLVNLLQKITSSQGNLQKQERYLFLKDSLVKESWPISRWPKFVADNVPHEHKAYHTIDDCQNDLSSDLIELFKHEGSRLDPWDLNRGHVIPWFLPYNIDLLSNDEGVKYRNSVRAGKIDDHFYQPIDRLFSSLAADIEVYLKRIGIHLHLNCNLDLKNPIQSLHPLIHTDAISKLIFAAPCQSLLSYSKPSLLKELSTTEFTRVVCVGEVWNSFIPLDMTQTLVLSALAPNLTRISNLPKSTGGNIASRKYLFEFQVPGKWNLSSDFLDSQLRNLFEHMNSDIVVYEFIALGSGFKPPSGWYTSARNSVYQWINSQNMKYRIDPYFGPINMAKAWLMSESLVNTPID